MPYVYCCHKIYLRYEDAFFYINISRIMNISSLKIQRVVWIMMMIEEGSTRAWS
jgi:hypothetical protein